METFVPLGANKLTKEDRAEAPELLMLVTEKDMEELKVEPVPMG